MGGQYVGGWRACARAVLLGSCVTLAGATAAGALIDVAGETVTLGWSQASGPVDAYLVYVSRNGGPLRAEAVTVDTKVTLEGSVGERIQMAVAGWSGQLAELGPLSARSEPIRLLGSDEPDDGGSGDDSGDGNDDGGDGDGDDGSVDDNDGGGNGDDDSGDDNDGGNSGGGGDGGDSHGDIGLPSLESTRILRMDRDWEILDVGSFDGDKYDDLLYRFAGDAGVYVLYLDDGTAKGSDLISFDGVSAARGPWRPAGDRALILTLSQGQKLAAWYAWGSGPEHRWAVGRKDATQAYTADLKGNVERILFRKKQGTLHDFDGKRLGVPTLDDEDHVMIWDVDRDGRDDVVVANPARGRIQAYLEGSRSHHVPALGADLEAVDLVDLDGDGVPEVVGIDRTGDVVARRLFGTTTQLLGHAGAGARLLGAQVDGRKGEGVLVQRGRELWMLTADR